MIVASVITMIAHIYRKLSVCQVDFKHFPCMNSLAGKYLSCVGFIGPQIKPLKGNVKERSAGHNTQTVILARWAERKGNFLEKKEDGQSQGREGRGTGRNAEAMSLMVVEMSIF